MKIFVPVTDAMLHNAQAIQGCLVPFNPEFLKIGSTSIKIDTKPANWISNSDYASARKRLLENRAV
ncbi:MAG: hypothetical protein QGD92_02770 [Gammaproteobacteria bacterium]|nr:hypothetical protein [Gammaproteobacteria bacterium]